MDNKSNKKILSISSNTERDREDVGLAAAERKESWLGVGLGFLIY